MVADEGVLFDPDRLIRVGGGLLAATAGSGGSIRAALADLDRDVLAQATDHGRPRAMVVVGAGGSSAAGDIVAACAGRGSAVPVVTTNGGSLPGWVGPLDVVVAVSASGASPESLEAVGEAARRGSALVGVGYGGQLADLIEQARGTFLRLRSGPQPLPARALTWALTVPLMLLADGLKVVDTAESALTAAADVLDEQALAFGPGVEPGINTAKDLAIVAAESLALVWGTAGVPAAAARRAGRQFAENAGIPVVVGAFPEIARTHARVLTGAWRGEEDIFRDRVAAPEPMQPPHLVLCRDDTTDVLSAELADAVASVARDAGVPVTWLDGGSGHPLVRFARLCAVTDFASVYAAAVLGVDPAGTAAALHPLLGSGR